MWSINTQICSINQYDCHQADHQSNVIVIRPNINRINCLEAKWRAIELKRINEVHKISV